VPDQTTQRCRSDHFKASLNRMPDLLADRPELICADIPAAGWTPIAEFEVREL
jgi:hypothetical protein